MTLTKEIWRKRLFEAINELTSQNLQKESWQNRENKNPHWTFVEFMCCYFDDLLIYDYPYYINNNWISQKEYEIIKDWHISIDNYKSPNGDDYCIEAILNDSEWNNILQKGLKAKKELLKILDKVEKQYLTEIIDFTKYS